MPQYQLINENINIIDNPNSQVTYQSQFLSEEVSDYLFNFFVNNLIWENDKAIIYGKEIITKRKIAWFANTNFNYNYSGINRIAQEWNQELIKLKQKLELETGYIFNSCLLNLYHDGTEGMGWHSDDQNHLKTNSPVAIISLGAERYFKLRNNNKSTDYKVILEKGSLLLMMGKTQQDYQHEIPKMLKIKDIRISLTWRSMKEEDSKKPN